MPREAGQLADPAPDADTAALSERDFHRVSTRIRTLAGIVLEPHKSHMIQARISRRVRALGLSSITEYLDFLESRDGRNETQSFIDTLTTNLTSFFREAHHFQHLEANVLKRPGDLRIWSAGCSSGEEPYSIALTAANVLGPQATRVKILATDLDSVVLGRAKRGVYPADKCGAIASTHKTFVGTGPEPDTLQISSTARNMVTFRQLNLMEVWPMRGPFDAIFCRNVVIYFSAETKAALLDRFAGLLRPGGFLYIGHSEAILGEHRFYRNCGNTIYQRKETSG